MKNFVVWTSNSSKLGDILSFFKYLSTSTEQSILALHDELKLLKLPNFSTIQQRLIEEFPGQSNIVTTVDDIINQEFVTSFDLCFCFENFNVQRSILFNDEKYPERVAVKVVVGGDQYNNLWLSPNEQFKFYLFSRSYKGVREFNLDHVFNQALLKSKNIEIFLFIKETDDRLYKFSGKFRAGTVQEDPDKSKFVVLNKI